MFRLTGLIFFIFLNQMAVSQQNKPQRIIHFAGLDWYVRSGQGNPDNNIWNNSKKSVWIDQQNRLHLKVRKINGRWYAAEIRSVKPTHYGIHRFYVSNRIDLLDKNLVAGLFLYKGHNQEVDIEFSKWRQKKALNTQYVVQPEITGNLKRFDVHLQGNYSTHLINWQAEKINFKSFYGHFLQAPDENYQIADWQYNKKRLVDDRQYYIHINLWLSKNQPPTDLQHTELIISALDTPVSPLIITAKKNYKAVSLYPNFDNHTLFMYLYNPLLEAKYQIITNQGKIIKTVTIRQHGFKIDFKNQPKGHYRLRVYNNRQVFEFFIKKND